MKRERVLAFVLCAILAAGLLRLAVIGIQPGQAQGYPEPTIVVTKTPPPCPPCTWPATPDPYETPVAPTATPQGYPSPGGVQAAVYAPVILDEGGMP